MYPPYLHKIICGSSNTEKYASGGGVKDFAAVYNEVVAEVMSKLNTDMASAKQIVDSEETWLKDMVELHGETNADYLAEHMLDSEKGEHKHKTGGGVHGKILKQNNTHKAVREYDKLVHGEHSGGSEFNSGGKVEEKYCVTVYSRGNGADVDDETITTEEYANKDKALSIAKKLPHNKTTEYIEVWKQDKDGYYGASGEPLYTTY